MFFYLYLIFYLIYIFVVLLDICSLFVTLIYNKFDLQFISSISYYYLFLVVVSYGMWLYFCFSHLSIYDQLLSTYIWHFDFCILHVFVYNIIRHSLFACKFFIIWPVLCWIFFCMIYFSTYSIIYVYIFFFTYVIYSNFLLILFLLQLI
jgi:hypothetical protein